MNITLEKSIWEPKPDSPIKEKSLCVHATHWASGISGIVFLDLMETPIDILNDIADDDWSHPLLEEMQRQAFEKMRAKAEQAYRELAA